MTKVLTAAEILAADDVKTLDVEVPEWGGTVRLRSMSGAEATRFIEATGKAGAGRGVHILALCAIDEEGKPLFSAEQVEALEQKNLAVLMRLQTAAMSLNSLDRAGDTAAKND